MPSGAASPSGWAGEPYAAAARHHRSFDDWFVAQLPPGPSDRVVDVGAGSGEFTARLAELVPDGHVIGVEPDPSMLAAARRHQRANLEFRAGTFAELDGVCGSGGADLVVSRAVLHWLPSEDHLDAFRATWRTLRAGGWFHAEWGGAGNVRRLRSVLDEVADVVGATPTRLTFHDAGTVLELLEQAGFEVPPTGVSTIAQRRGFDREQLLAFVRTQATMAYRFTGAEDRERFVSEVVARLDALRRHDGSFDQTFVRLHVRCRRPGRAAAPGIRGSEQTED
ncbi:methyltransferase domain-containing protein [Egicoccus sp. AB-alg2]|uniref:class I SAM-dependent methyltransferase n=1 Tax=Egicoccus sp. AB-alg2 TaxID=3242693 RepID=UPI00359D0968